MKWFKRTLSNLEYNYGWLRVIDSPFVKLKWKFKWYKTIERGTPYFLPRKLVKFTKKDCIDAYAKEKAKFIQANSILPKNMCINSFKRHSKFVPIKYFGINYWSLGWKTKWSDTDVRFEWGPGLSIVLFGTQVVIYPVPDCNNNARHHYWEAWIIYHYYTDKTKNVENRLIECMSLYPAKWIKYEGEKKIPINYWKYILKDKYKYLIDE